MNSISFKSFVFNLFLISVDLSRNEKLVESDQNDLSPRTKHLKALDKTTNLLDIKFKCDRIGCKFETTNTEMIESHELQHQNEDKDNDSDVQQNIISNLKCDRIRCRFETKDIEMFEQHQLQCPNRSKIVGNRLTTKITISNDNSDVQKLNSDQNQVSNDKKTCTSRSTIGKSYPLISYSYE